MNCRRCVYCFFVVGLSTGITLSPAHAQPSVGEAVVIQNEVLRGAEAATTAMSVGDAVLRNDAVQTGAYSAARFVMADSTNLSLGPNAKIRIDRSVFNDEHSYRDIAINMTSGAFRWVTGHSDKNAYKITTPLATIGIRGTILDVLSQRGQTTVVLQEGAASVCTLGFQCTQLTQPGDTVIVTATGGGRVTTKKTNNPSWSFAQTCSAAAGLCTITDLAGAQPSQEFTGILCGR